MGSILRFGDPIGGEPSSILVSHPASLTSRVNGVVRMSLDEGKTWTSTKKVCQGRFAYSCLTKLPDGRVGLLFETGDDSPYERLVLARFSLSQLA